DVAQPFPDVVEKTALVGQKRPLFSVGTRLEVTHLDMPGVAPSCPFKPATAANLCRVIAVYSGDVSGGRCQRGRKK
ncbi:MAG: hypothetical protein ACO3FE_15925, partial [Planctomycetaceae bacterium]